MLMASYLSFLDLITEGTRRELRVGIVNELGCPRICVTTTIVCLMESSPESSTHSIFGTDVVSSFQSTQLASRAKSNTMKWKIANSHEKNLFYILLKN